MIINCLQLGDEPRHYEGEDPPEVLVVEGGVPIHIDSPLRYALDAELITGRILVDGRLEAKISTSCGRCGKGIQLTITESAYHYDADASECGESVDLTDDMRDAMVVLFPSYPLCDRECKGLCPQCGINLNEDECGCQPPGEDGRWSLLEKWKP